MVSRLHAPLKPVELAGWRVRLGTLAEADHPAWFEIRRRYDQWLVPSERPSGEGCAFDAPSPQRAEIAIVPRHHASGREVEKLGIRSDGGTLGCLEIDGASEDHVRYDMTPEEWQDRRGALLGTWLRRAA